MSTKLFGTDGIRGRAGEYPLNSRAVVAIGRAIGERLNGKILIGRDTRLSSPWIFDLLQDGIRQTGSEIEDAGVIPTPAIALLTNRQHRFAGGVMISASHNPYDDNGIKIFSGDGRKLSDADEDELEKRIRALAGLSDGAADEVNDEVDKVAELPQHAISSENPTGWPDLYEELLLSHFAGGRWLSGMRLVVDCANGAMSAVAPAALSKLGAAVTVIHAQPSGTNINADCGAVHLDALVTAMKENTADLGVAFDGDGDRSMFISSSGRHIDGDAVLLMMARKLHSENRMQPPVVIGTQMTNYSLERLLAAQNIELTRVGVGDRFIFEEMQRVGAVLGGEPSGHIIFSDFGLSGDGLLTTLKVVEAVATAHSSVDGLTEDWVPAPQLLKGVRVKDKVPIERIPALQSKVREVERELSGHGRVLVRYSGTEPLLRVMIESDDAARNEKLMKEVLEVIAENLPGVG